MSVSFQEATRERLKLRMAVDGPSGGGKTATALRFAQCLAKMERELNGREGRIAVIDTENRSASKYVGEDFGEGSIHFKTKQLTSFAPTVYASAIDEAFRAGFDVLVIDSLSHAWEGVGGALDMVDKSGAKNSYTAWKDVTPMHRRMVDAILQVNMHVIVTMRSKTEYVLEDVGGKQVPRRIGVAPVQRAGMEYEFDLYGSLDLSHLFTVTKTRCPAVDGMVVPKPGGDFMRSVIDWLNVGTEAAESHYVAPIMVKMAEDSQIQKVLELGVAMGKKLDQINAHIFQKFNIQNVGDLTADAAAAIIKEWGTFIENRKLAQQRQAAAAPTASASSQATPATASPATSQTAKSEALVSEAAKQDAAAQASATAESPAKPEKASVEQAARLVELKSALGLSQTQFAAGIARYTGASENPLDLTAQQAREAISNLEAAVARKNGKTTAA